MFNLLTVLVALLFSLVLSGVQPFARHDVSFFILLGAPLTFVLILGHKFRGIPYGDFDAEVTKSELGMILKSGVFFIVFLGILAVLVLFGLAPDWLYLFGAGCCIALTVIVFSTMPALFIRFVQYAYRGVEVTFLLMLVWRTQGYSQDWWVGEILFYLCLMGLGRLVWYTLWNWRKNPAGAAYTIIVLWAFIAYAVSLLHVQLLFVVYPVSDWQTSVTAFGTLAFFIYAGELFEYILYILEQITSFSPRVMYSRFVQI